MLCPTIYLSFTHTCILQESFGNATRIDYGSGNIYHKFTKYFACILLANTNK